MVSYIKLEINGLSIAIQKEGLYLNDYTTMIHIGSSDLSVVIEIHETNTIVVKTNYSDKKILSLRELVEYLKTQQICPIHQ